MSKINTDRDEKTFRTDLPIFATSITLDLDDTQLSWLVEKMPKRGIPLHWNPDTERLEVQVVLLLGDLERVALLVLDEDGSNSHRVRAEENGMSPNEYALHRNDLIPIEDLPIRINVVME